MAQVPCPGCGGFRVFSQAARHFDPLTGARVEPRGSAKAALTLARTSLFLVLASWALLYADQIAGVFPVLTSAALVGWPLALLWAFAHEMRKPLPEQLDGEWHNFCESCGHAWSWRSRVRERSAPYVWELMLRGRGGAR